MTSVHVQVIRDRRVTCPKTGSSIQVKDCFTCDKLKQVSLREGGELLCRSKAQERVESFPHSIRK